MFTDLNFLSVSGTISRAILIPFGVPKTIEFMHGVPWNCDRKLGSVQGADSTGGGTLPELSWGDGC